MKWLASLWMAVCFLHTANGTVVNKADFLKIPDSVHMQVDAKANEYWWSQAKAISGFIQASPETGQPATQATEVKVLYDNTALYIYSKMEDVDRDSILMELSVRDELFSTNTDIFGIYIDAYQSGNSALGFFVSPRNVQADIFYTPDAEDRSWDVVWRSATRVTEEGWYAEFKIPYAALRFPNKEKQFWNLNFIRRIRRNRETAHWKFIDPNIDGFINQFGKTDTLTNIDPPLRLSFTPYIAAVSQKDPAFDWDHNIRGGMDLKWGINESFTLDVTLIPDFSQVRTDNQVLNLSPFEVQFQENRPFFTEGIDLFDRGELFYSRRIGNQPIQYEKASRRADQSSELEVIENPATTQLLNATKLSGRTNNGLGIGILNAVVNRSNALLRNKESGDEITVKTQPISNYNMLVLDQNLPHNSSIALINTNVWRNGITYDANVTALETRLRNEEQTYQFKGFAALTQKYYSDTADLGYRYNLRYGKISGSWRWEGAYNVESASYDPNDFGFLLAPNERTLSASGGYYKNEPFGNFVRANVVLSSSYRRLHRPNKYSGWNLNLNSFLLSKNFWGYGVFGSYQPIENRDYFEPRIANFSKYLPVPENYRFGGFISSNYAEPFALDVRSQYQKWNQDGRWSWFLALEPRFRFSDRFSLIGGINYTELYNDQGWVRPETSDFEGTLIGTRDQVIFVTYILSKYTFTNRINFNIRLRHYWSNVVYNDFLNLDENSDLVNINYPGEDLSDDIHDINFNTLNIDANLTWRFAAGSDLILSWNGQLISFTETEQSNYLKQLGTIINEPQQTTLSLKILYFLDYQMIEDSL
jgi:hypothetical protein